ncbi:MAG: DinB family protein [Balneolaceae bacterium]
MKKITSLIALSLFIVSATAQTSEADKEFVIKYLTATHQNIVNTVNELSDEAWNYIPEAGGWSVANALEHILVTEGAFTEMAQGTIAQAEVTNTDLSGSDGMLIGNLANRGTKVTTAPQFEPSGRWDSKADMLDALEESRNNLIEFISFNDANFRNYKASLPFGEVDIVQLLLVISAHSQRHTFQMQEVLSEYAAM